MHTMPVPPRSVTFRILALPPEPFAPLFGLPDAQLQARGIRRVVADACPGYPCRVSLEDAAPGEELLLLQHEHHPTASPFRASGPIFVRRAAHLARPAPGEIPELLRRRMLSLRAYDVDGTMRHAELCEGAALDTRLPQVLGLPEVRYVHLHHALRGCFLASAVHAP